jgi:hypothetical protein
VPDGAGRLTARASKPGRRRSAGATGRSLLLGAVRRPPKAELGQRHPGAVCLEPPGQRGALAASAVDREPLQPADEIAQGHDLAHRCSLLPRAQRQAIALPGQESTPAEPCAARVSPAPWRPLYLLPGIRMPPTKPALSTDLKATIERVTPDVLALLGDGVPRTRGTIITALADRHPKDDVRRTLMRLAVTEQLVETGGRYTLPASGPEQS